MRIPGLIVFVLLFCAGTAAAQSSSSDQLPASNDVNDATDNTDVGLLQIELGGQFTDTAPGERTAGFPFSARYGAFEWLEFSLGADGLLIQTDRGTQATGFGNLEAGGKIQMFGRTGGLPIISLLPQVVVPTADAESGLGTGDWDFSLGVLTGRDFSHDSHVDLSYGVGAIGEGAGLGRFAQQAAAISASIGLTRAWTPSLTVSWLSRQDVDTGAAWTVTGESVLTASRRVAFDISAQFGVSPEAPELELAAGVSFVVGTLDEAEGVHARRHHLHLRSRRHTGPRPR